MVGAAWSARHRGAVIQIGKWRTNMMYMQLTERTRNFLVRAAAVTGALAIIVPFHPTTTAYAGGDLEKFAHQAGHAVSAAATPAVRAAVVAGGAVAGAAAGTAIGAGPVAGGMVGGALGQGVNDYAEGKR